MTENITQAIELLRKESKKRKFNQTFEIIVNLKGIDLRRENVSTVATIPHGFKEKKVCGFLTKKSEIVKTVTKPEFEKFNDKDLLKQLVSEYDFFIAHASLMPSVASTFGKVLGPAGKMPSPQLGLVTDESPEAIQKMLDKIAKSVKIRAKEPSIKVAIGKENMKDEELAANATAIYNEIMNALPNKKENIKNVMVKMTMTKPVKTEMK